MWIFGKHGHLSIGQYPFDHELLVVRAQMREELDSFVGLLDEIGGQKHKVEEKTEEDYRFEVMGKRAVVAEAVAKMVATIDDYKFLHSFHVDFGKKPGFLVWMNRTGLKVATVRE
jgi:hypothetical protein